ncbi:MAG: tRNA 2-thiouridine(34) synthase MnmA [Candidatus Moraniibacteriota bacterium]|nr:MAG: tRNA 2-thiouridine(34) synthase MnmA [Candidatus Moranbacteria bacterium]
MRLACLVSGGVDSSVALTLAKDSGHEVHAFYLKIWLEDEMAFLGECPWENDLTFVRSVCKKLNVPLTIVPLQKEYHDRVISYALSEVREGRTPNPDIMCNSLIKFGAFQEWLEKNDTSFEKIVTGHYARSGEYKKVHGETFSIMKLACDRVKDQTYFLSRLTKEQLRRTWFPLGEYEKSKVREMAKEKNLLTFDRPDSQGLCFLGKIRYSSFIKHHLGTMMGDIVDISTGRILGKHEGHWFHTVGQRHGLDLSGGPWYVVGKDIQKNNILVSHRLKMPETERAFFGVRNTSWFLDEEDLQKNFLQKKLFCKIRHGEKRYQVILEGVSQNISDFSVRILKEKERGITPGQFAVFYSDDMCLGSGVIVE